LQCIHKGFSKFTRRLTELPPTTRSEWSNY